MAGLVKLQKKIVQEKPARPIFHLPGGSQGTQRDVLVDGYAVGPVTSSNVPSPLLRHIWLAPRLVT